MTRPVDQIALPLDWPRSGDAERFILGDANRAAYDHFRQWALWPVKATLLTGPRRSGRSLLARNFVARVHGRLFDDAHEHDEEALFHAWNAAQDSGHPLVIVADEGPPAWAVRLPDLRTRLAITPVTRIEQPDDALFAGLIQLYFADRGLHLPAEALRYVTTRVERSYWSAERIVEAVDRFAIAERARLTIPVIRRALDQAGLIGVGKAA
ncbi:HdaA/DnaA family protein [Sphingomonas sp.]|uniref:HdaA/DnaA family protein n=1 Tax=Sphingomonas sp. TaxID=28214 RepID=UPI00286B235A|nr:DnaA/Hda family protein [Sphingomonas sp.]